MRWFIALMVAVMCFAGTAAYAANAYEDVSNDHWAYNALDYLTKRGVLEGYPDGFFKGDRTLTRYEFAQAIARLLDTIGPNNGEEIRVMAETLRAEFSDQLAQLHGEMNEMSNMVYGLDAKVADLEGGVADNAARIDGLENKIAGLKPGPNWKGSFRYRWEYIDSDYDGNDRFRQRIAFKLGYSKKLNDGVTVGFRFATNTGADSRSANFDLGNYTNTADIYLDEAWALITPPWFGFYTEKDCSDCNPRLNILIGMFDKSPAIYDPNEMILDSDIRAQGIAGVYHFNEDFQISAVAGIVKEFKGDYTDDDIWMYSAEARHDNLFFDCLDAWVGCYGFDNENYLPSGVFEGNMLYGFDFNNDGLVDGNDRFTPNYNIVKGGLQYTWNCWFNKPLAVYGEYMVNIDSDADVDIAAVNPFVNPDIIYEDSDDFGWVVGAQYGSKPKYCGDWYAFGRYKEIGANAIIDGFGDADTMGANRNSFEFHYATMWADNCVVGITYIFSKMHNAFGFAIPNKYADESKIQLDWNFKF